VKVPAGWPGLERKSQNALFMVGSPTIGLDACFSLARWSTLARFFGKRLVKFGRRAKVRMERPAPVRI
jgi:hypothetical protein